MQDSSESSPHLNQSGGDSRRVQPQNRSPVLAELRTCDSKTTSTLSDYASTSFVGGGSRSQPMVQQATGNTEPGRIAQSAPKSNSHSTCVPAQPAVHPADLDAARVDNYEAPELPPLGWARSSPIHAAVQDSPVAADHLPRGRAESATPATAQPNAKVLQGIAAAMAQLQPDFSRHPQLQQQQKQRQRDTRLLSLHEQQQLTKLQQQLQPAFSGLKKGPAVSSGLWKGALMVLAFGLFVDWLLLASTCRHWVFCSAAVVCAALGRFVGGRLITPAASLIAALFHDTIRCAVDCVLLPLASAAAAGGRVVQGVSVAVASGAVASLDGALWPGASAQLGTTLEVVGFAVAIAAAVMAAIGAVRTVAALRHEARTGWPTGMGVAAKKLQQARARVSVSGTTLAWTDDDIQYQRDLAWYFSLREALPLPLRRALLWIETQLESPARDASWQYRRQVSHLLRWLSSTAVLLPSLQPPARSDTANSLAFVSFSVLIVGTIVTLADYMWLTVYKAVKSSGGLPAWQAAAFEQTRAVTAMPRAALEAAAAALLASLHCGASVVASVCQGRVTAMKAVGPAYKAKVAALTTWLEAALCTAVDGQWGVGSGAVVVLFLKRAALAGIFTFMVLLVRRIFRKTITQELQHSRQQAKDAN